MASNDIEAQVRNRIAKMREYKNRVAQVIDAGLAEHAEEVAALAKQLSPVRTGFNREHIEAAKVGYRKYKVLATSPYAVYLELGTANAPAEPFLFPASEALRALLVPRLRAALKRG
jgi:HK97 gp10 family phage protein